MERCHDVDIGRFASRALFLPERLFVPRFRAISKTLYDRDHNLLWLSSSGVFASASPSFDHVRMFIDVRVVSSRYYSDRWLLFMTVER
jgi:hypothetical protein